MSKVQTAQALAKLRAECRKYFADPNPGPLAMRPTANQFKCPVTRGYAQQIIDDEEAKAKALRRRA